MTSLKYTLTSEHAIKYSTPYTPPSPTLRTASDSAISSFSSVSTHTSSSSVSTHTSSSSHPTNILRRSAAYWDLTSIPPETTTTATITLVLVPTTLLVPAAPSDIIRRVAFTVDTLGTVGMLRQEICKVIADETTLGKRDGDGDEGGMEEFELGRKSILLWHNGGILEDRELVWECGLKEGDEVRVVYEPGVGEARRSSVGVKELVAAYPLP